MVDDLNSLPPKVSGSIYGYLDIKISEIIWNRRADCPVKIKINWWGQDRSEFNFLLGSNHEKTLHTYSILTNLSLFRNYLKNCKILTLSVVDKQMDTLIGTCVITELNTVIDVPNEKLYPILNHFNSVIGYLRVGFQLSLLSTSKSKVTSDSHSNFKINYDHYLKSNSLVSSLQRTSSDVQSELDSDSNCVSSKLIKKVLKQGQRLRNAMVETILDNDPLNKDVYNQVPVLDLHNKNLLSSSVHNQVHQSSVLSNYDDTTKVFDYLMGRSVSQLEEKQILNTIRSLSPATSMIKLASDIHFQNIPQTHPDNIPSHNTNESERTDKSKRVEKASDRYAHLLTTKSQESENNYDTLSERIFKLLNHVDSMKIFIYNLKLNPAGWRKVIGSENIVLKNRISTFFIEYTIPELLTPEFFKGSSRLKRGIQENNNIRLCSKKVTQEVIHFKQQSIHSVANLSSLNLNTVLLELKVHSRNVSQRGAIPLGVAKCNLFEVTQQSDLTLDQELVLQEMNKPLTIGTLKVRIQFGCDKLHFGKDFIDAILSEKENRKLSGSDSLSKLLEKETTTLVNKRDGDLKKHAKLNSCNKTPEQFYFSKSATNKENDELAKKNDVKISSDNIISLMKLLHGLIHVREVVFNSDEKKNTFLICRAFWREDTTTSKLYHHTQRAVYNFSETVPILYDSNFLLRTKNNFLVVEIWENNGKTENLLGICKLPLHQFFVAYRDPKVAVHLVESKFPVIGFDGWEDIIHPISLEHYGQLQALLAVGTESQLHFLEISRGINAPSIINNHLAYSEISYSNAKFDAEKNSYKTTKKPDLKTVNDQQLNKTKTCDFRRLEEKPPETEIIDKDSVDEEYNKIFEKIDESVSFLEIEKEKKTAEKCIQTDIDQSTQTENLLKIESDKESQSDLTEDKSKSDKRNKDSISSNENIIHQKLFETFMEIATKFPITLESQQTQTTPMSENRAKLIVDKSAQVNTNLKNKGTEMDCDESTKTSSPLLQETSKLMETLQRALSMPSTAVQDSELLHPVNNVQYTLPLFNSDKNRNKSTTSTNTYNKKANSTTFKAHIVIENAVHLSVRRRRIKNKGKHGKRPAESAPSTYVTFEPTPEEGILITSVVQKSSNPKWNQHFECYLPKDLLYDDQKRLIFKVWNKNDGDLSRANIVTDSVIGFAALDLTVLSAGLPSIQGWFNIVDFSSRCNGQIKINLTPLENIHDESASSTESNITTPISIENEILDVPSTSLLSNALKRKFSELDEITERLKQRLMDVTKDDTDEDENKDFEFEHDLNTEPISEEMDDFDFTKLELSLQQNDGKSNTACYNTILSGVSTADSGYVETSAVMKENETTKTNLNIDSSLVSLSEIDQRLKESKVQFDALFERLTLHSALLNSAPLEEVISDKRTQFNEDLTSERKTKCLEDITEESSNSDLIKHNNSENNEDLNLALSLGTISSSSIIDRGTYDKFSSTISDSDTIDSLSETVLLNREGPEGAGNASTENLNQTQKKST